MAKLNLETIQSRLRPLGQKTVYDRDFIFELLEAYGKPKSTVTRLRTGSLNVADDRSHDIALKGVLHFREIESEKVQLFETMVSMQHEPVIERYKPRFLIVTDYTDLVALDTITRQFMQIPITDIENRAAFFLPWAGIDKTHVINESHADLRAAQKLGTLFDELLSDNLEMLADTKARSGMSLFFTRLLFCLFAEDTGIFKENQFTNALASLTKSDGSDVHSFLNQLFNVLDTKSADGKPNHFIEFPYVNGKLFNSYHHIIVPKFSRKSRLLLIEMGSLNWKSINPDIFGSMFQSIVNPTKRSDLGQHYTSVSNILKTIKPLFLDELRDQFDRCYHDTKGLEELLDRIANIRIFDPACGSGNFLVIAYKELRRLEHAILSRLATLDTVHQRLFTDSRIDIEHFFGIEIDSFAADVAILSLWIAKHQMNQEFKEIFGVEIPLIPLKEICKIHTGNATRLNWNDVCPNDGNTEIYLISNPPYVGTSMQSHDQKLDFHHVFNDRPFNKKLDYISLWFVKGADYIRNTKASLAFVSTNSITQGDHVGHLFPHLLFDGIEIGFAYRSFKWQNNAKYNAGVTVIVLSLRNASNKKKFIFDHDNAIEYSKINPYFVDANDIFVHGRTKPISSMLPPMTYGSKPVDGGALILDTKEYLKLKSDPNIHHSWLKRFIGADEFINSYERYCIWIEEKDYSLAKRIDVLDAAFEKVRTYRTLSRKYATNKLANHPYRFAETRYKDTDSIIVPSVSSERRDYIPIGYLGGDTVISNLAFAVYDAEPWLFALLSSRMHMAWLRAVGGQLETRLRYSNTLVYNTFPVPDLTPEIKENLTEAALRVLDVRDYHSERTLADLYDPDKMPTNLRQAHQMVDILVDSLYLQYPFESDEQRLSLLFAKYEHLIANEKTTVDSKSSKSEPGRKKTTK